MDTYLFWQPDGITGCLQAESPFKAAEQILGCKPVYCGSENLYHYVTSNQNKRKNGHDEVKIWLKIIKE